MVLNLGGEILKILWITLESILPANTGGRIGVYKRLEQIAKTEDVYLFYPYDDEKELEYVSKLEFLCKEVHPYSRQKNIKYGLLNLWKYPFTVSSRKIDDMGNDIEKCIQNNKIDVINVDFPHMCACLQNINCDVPIVLNEHNIEWQVYRTIANSHKNALKKVAYYIDSFRLKHYERKIVDKLNPAKVTFVSSKDMQYMVDNGFVTSNDAVLIPVGADEHLCEDRVHIGTNIVFVGKMSYGPNIEAAKWFAKEVMPKILAEDNARSFKFYIVGKDPTDEVKQLASENIVVTGMVDDVSKYYDLADLVVLPLKNGGGVKVKLLEAISYRKPIVSTTVGVEGTYYANHYIPVADNSAEFAKLCSDILYDKEVYPEKSIYEYFDSNYTWQCVGRKYLHVFTDLLKNR